MGITRRQAMRQIVGGGVATTAMVVAPRARAQQVEPPTLNLIEALDVNPNDPALISLIWSNSPDPRYIPESALLPNNFAEGMRHVLEIHSNGEYRVGSQTRVEDIQLFGQERRDYLALENGQVVNAFSADVIVSRTAQLQLVCVIGFSDQVKQQDKILWEGFIDKYKAAADGAPDQNVPNLDDFVLSEALHVNLDPSQVIIIMRVEVVAVGQMKVWNDPYLNAQSVVSGKYSGKIARIGSNNRVDMVVIKSELGSRKITYKVISSTRILRPTGFNQSNSSMFVDGNNSTTPDRAADSVAEKYARGLDCKLDFSQGSTHEVMSLLRYPEFKIEMVRVTIRIRVRWRFIRFSLTMFISLPRLFTRFSDLYLIAWSRWPKDSVPSQLQTVIGHCVLTSALIGAVVGVFLSNPAMAWTAFSGAFERCLKDQAFAFVKCMIPGLAIKRVVSTDWS